MFYGPTACSKTCWVLILVPGGVFWLQCQVFGMGPLNPKPLRLIGLILTDPFLHW